MTNHLTYLKLSRTIIDDESRVRKRVPMDSLLEACSEGNVVKVKILLAAGADPGVRDVHSERTPLHRAARHGHADVVNTLLAAGADRECRDDTQRTPLHYAAYCGRAEVVNSLLAAGADRECWDDTKMTPLHYAARHGHAEVVSTLVDAGVDRDVQNINGNTPSHLAAQQGFVQDVYILLLKAGANMLIVNNDNKCAKDIASVLFTSLTDAPTSQPTLTP